MDTKAIVSNLMKPDTVKSISEETGAKKSVVEEIIKNAVPMLAKQFGQNPDNAATTQKVTAKTGISSDVVMKVIGALAPLVIAYLARQVASPKESATKSSKKDNNPIIDVATSVLDKNKDGNIIDDLVGGLFGKK